MMQIKLLLLQVAFNAMTLSSLCSSILLHLIFGTLLKSWSINERSWLLQVAFKAMALCE